VIYMATAARAAGKSTAGKSAAKPAATKTKAAKPTAVRQSSLAEVGEAAGLVWHALNGHGEVALAKLVKDLDQPRDLVMQAIGWLAREDKIEIVGDAKSRSVSLR
jgi:Winged helix-turn-helix domain (DUF2582)